MILLVPVPSSAMYDGSLNRPKQPRLASRSDARRMKNQNNKKVLNATRCPPHMTAMPGFGAAPRHAMTQTLWSTSFARLRGNADNAVLQQCQAIFAVFDGARDRRIRPCLSPKSRTQPPNVLSLPLAAFT